MAWYIEHGREGPTKTLNGWCVYDVLSGGLTALRTRHLVGFRLEGCNAQVSSPGELFDSVSRRDVTRGGQANELPVVKTRAFVAWSTGCTHTACSRLARHDNEQSLS